MKTSITAAILFVFACAAQAQEWRYQAPDPNNDNSVFFYAYINQSEYADSGQGNDLTLIRDPYNADLQPSGLCSFDNCTFKVSLNGQYPSSGDRISLLFSNGYQMSWQHDSGVAFLENYSVHLRSNTNNFDRNIRRSEWVEISYSGMTHRFSLIGSNAAMDAIIPFLKGS